MYEPSVAARADYADAILSARRAKNALFLLLLVVLLGQVALFFIARHTPLLSSQPATTQPTLSLDWIRYFVALTQFGGLIGSILLAAVLLLLTIAMLASRTLGVAKVTSALIASIVLLVLLFPWQAVLASPSYSTSADPNAKDFKIPGVLYTWPELSHPTMGANFESNPVNFNVILHWARFVGFPAVAVILLMSIQVRSSSGIKSALGEDRGDLIAMTPTT